MSIEPDATDGPDGAETAPVVLEMIVPATSFLMDGLLAECPDLTVEGEQLVPVQARPIPYVWSTGADLDRVERAAAADPTVERFRRLATFDSGGLHAVTWNGDDRPLYRRFVGGQVSVLQGEATAGEWTLKTRFASREALSAFQTFLKDESIDRRVVRIYSLDDPKLGQFNITRKQREILVEALEMGYFEIPREATLGEVADVVGISTKAASERLRRGQTNLLNNSLTVGKPSGIGLPDESA